MKKNEDYKNEDYKNYVIYLNNLNDEIEIAFIERNKKKIEKLELPLNELEKKIPYQDLKCYLYFLLAGIYDFYSKYENNFEHKGYKLDSDNNKRELSFYRKAIYSEGFKDLQITQYELKLKLLTNYANLLNFLGRTLEAIEIWDLCIKESPNFGMAYANIGIALDHIIIAINDEYHQKYLYCKKIELFEEALKGYLEPEAKEMIDDELKNINVSNYNQVLNYLNEYYSLGASVIEQNYRMWVLQNQLYLNPLNIISKKPIVARDVFHLPDLTENKNQNKLSYFFLFNKLKQEFVSARYIFYEATIIEKNETHFSDKDVLLQSPLGNECIHSLSIEKLIFCYRSLFSIFDKIAFFINMYLELGYGENNINFNNMWYRNLKYKDGIEDKFHFHDLPSSNPFLRGLYNLSRDIYYNNKSELIYDPDIKIIKDLRNNIEHKFIRVFNENSFDINDNFKDTISYSIQYSEFERITLKLLKLSLSAIYYLSFLVKIEEDKIKNDSSEKKKIFMRLSKYDDDFKRIFN